jgi:uncharacterized protein (DUF1499 family)
MEMWKRLVLAVLVLGGVAAATTWPHLNDVETGRTPEYPDLQVRSYRKDPKAVIAAARAAVDALPRFRYVGGGSGPAGSAIQAVASSRVFRFQDDVTVHVRSEGGVTRVSVRSRSRIGKWDFGQNARNIRELLAALDRELR